MIICFDFRTTMSEVNVKELREGEWILSKRYMRFEKKRDVHAQYFVHTSGQRSWMSNDLITKWCISSEQYTDEKKVNRTDLARRLHNAGESPFTVVFKNQNGDLRELVGYLVNVDEMMGRARVVDLNIDDKNNVRLVDYRTLESLVLNNVKYSLK